MTIIIYQSLVLGVTITVKKCLCYWLSEFRTILASNANLYKFAYFRRFAVPDKPAKTLVGDMPPNP